MESTSRIQVPENARVLELGCGTGLLWRGAVKVPRRDGA